MDENKTIPSYFTQQPNEEEYLNLTNFLLASLGIEDTFKANKKILQWLLRDDTFALVKHLTKMTNSNYQAGMFNEKYYLADSDLEFEKTLAIWAYNTKAKCLCVRRETTPKRLQEINNRQYDYYIYANYELACSLASAINPNFLVTLLSKYVNVTGKPDTKQLIQLALFKD